MQGSELFFLNKIDLLKLNINVLNQQFDSTKIQTNTREIEDRRSQTC